MAEGWALKKLGSTSCTPSSLVDVSCTMLWPPPLPPAASVPTDAKVSTGPSSSTAFSKNSMSVWGLPVGMDAIGSHSAPGPPLLTAPDSGTVTGDSPGAGWSKPNSSWATAAPGMLKTSGTPMASATSAPLVRCERPGSTRIKTPGADGVNLGEP